MSVLEVLSQSAPEREDILFDSSIPLSNGQNIKLSELVERFYSDERGKHMLSQPLRYSQRYGYDRESMHNDLGKDVCPIGHQTELAYHLAQIINREREDGTVFSLSDEEAGTVLFAAFVHDIGECTHETIETAVGGVVGDVPSGDKTDANRDTEASIRTYFYETIFADVDPEVINQIEAIITHRDQTHLHDQFDAAHWLQVVETSNFAHQTLEEIGWYRSGETIDLLAQDGARLSGLLGISRHVAESALPRLQQFSYLGHVQAMHDEATLMRNPPHVLFH